jgi:hypothetical protein
MCGRGCAAQVLFSCLRGHPRGVRTCRHGRSWKLVSSNGFYAVTMWSSWRRRWVARLMETVVIDEGSGWP